jgi:flagellar basal body-associated protein FliL
MNPLSKRTKIIIIAVIALIVIGGVIYFIRKSKKAKTNAKLNGTPTTTTTTDTSTTPVPAPKTVRSVAKDASGAPILKEAKPTAVSAE